MNDRTYRDAFNERWNHLMAGQPVAAADRRWGEGEEELLDEWRWKPWGIMQLANNLRMVWQRFVDALKPIGQRIADFFSQWAWFRLVEVQETHLRSRDGRVRPLRAEPGRTLRPVLVDQRTRIRAFYGRRM